MAQNTRQTNVEGGRNRKDSGGTLPGELGGASQKGAVGYRSQAKGSVNRSRTEGGSEVSGIEERGYVKKGRTGVSVRKTENGPGKRPRISPGG